MENDQKSEKSNTVNEKNENNILSWITVDDIVKDREKYVDENVCEFCHLPGNYFNVLGDLYGPYKPTFQEMIDSICDSLTENDLDTGTTLSKEILKNSKIKIDVTKGICHMSAPSILQYISLINNKDKQSLNDCLLTQLELMQTFDYLLDDQKKNTIWNLWNKKTKIPGFTGDITFKWDKNKPVDRQHFKSIETIVLLDSKIDILNCDFDENLDKSDPKLCFKFNCKSVWTHMDCAIWTPGIYAVQEKVHGIIPAVNGAKELICPICNFSGATIPSKSQRNKSFHFPCAIAKGIKMNEETFSLE